MLASPMWFCRAALPLLLLACAGCTTPRPLDGGPVDGALADAPSHVAPIDTPVLDAPTADSPSDATCAVTCAGDRLVGCGMDEPCALGCLSGPPAHCAELVVTNLGDVVDTLPVGAMPVVVTTNQTIDTTSCTWGAGPSGLTGTVVSMTDGASACVFRVRALTIAASATVRGTGRLPLILVSDTTIAIEGTLSVDSIVGSMGAGSGTGGLAGLDGTRNGPEDGGGGGGGFGGAGGGGGDTPAATGGAGGAGAAQTLEPLVGGANGGAGSGLSPAAGGAGGGALQLTARESIRVSGTLGASGGGGSSAMAGAGSGGGSGGGILLEAPELDLADATLNIAGGGGAGGTCSFGTAPGQDGMGRTDAPQGGSGCAAGGPGGNGMGGSRTTGEPGSSGSNNGGGGGGGAGAVRFRSVAPPSLASARLNPRMMTGLYVVGPLSLR